MNEEWDISAPLAALCMFAALMAYSFFAARHRAQGWVCAAELNDYPRPHSRPHYHGLFAMQFGVLPVVILYLVFLAFYKPAAPNESWMAAAIATSCAAIGCWLAISRIHPAFTARIRVEWAIKAMMGLCAAASIFITLAIVLSVLSESIRFFNLVPIEDFLFGLQWSPTNGTFGAVPLFTGTAMIMLIAMCVAVPVGLFAAIYMAEYAGSRKRSIIKPILELLAGIPTVVYGFFAVITLSPFIKQAGASLGLSVASESALAAGLTMGIMIIPFVSSLADDVITAVPRALRDASLGLGATRSETVRHVIIPAALPGIMGGILLAVSRAMGETMIVVMAAGMSANLTANPFEAVTTVTVQIVSLLVGDQEFDSAKTLVAFALGLTLFVFTLILNIIALQIVRRYREQYE